MQWLSKFPQEVWSPIKPRYPVEVRHGSSLQGTQMLGIAFDEYFSKTINTHLLTILSMIFFLEL